MTTPVDELGVQVAIHDDVLRIELNRPERNNALDSGAISTFVDALEKASTNDGLRGILISGRGDNFCSGADWVASNSDQDVRPRTGSLQRRTPLQAHRIIELLMSVQLPIVCAVQGWAAGLGCQIALASDFTIATESSRFWEPFLSRGFTPDSGSTWLVPRLIGVARARDFLMLGRELSGTEAASIGLIHRAVPDANIAEAAKQLVDELASAATVAIGLTKQCINRSLQSGLAEAMENESFALEVSSRSQDFKEGLLAFRERRPADFRGR
jgi:2-(1,2-epoxy-1,2-dihydrophenyl)acetyl-CoA isomerase